jgi:hypothetical protein
MCIVFLFCSVLYICFYFTKRRLFSNVRNGTLRSRIVQNDCGAHDGDGSRILKASDEGHRDILAARARLRGGEGVNVAVDENASSTERVRPERNGGHGESAKAGMHMLAFPGRNNGGTVRNRTQITQWFEIMRSGRQHLILSGTCLSRWKSFCGRRA